MRDGKVRDFCLEYHRSALPRKLLEANFRLKESCRSDALVVLTVWVDV